MRTTKQVILDALHQHMGDDAPRARMAFAGLSPRVMQQQYGQSGRTRQEILDEYEQHEREVCAAIAHVQARMP